MSLSPSQPPSVSPSLSLFLIQSKLQRVEDFYRSIHIYTTNNTDSYQGEIRILKEVSEEILKFCLYGIFVNFSLNSISQ